MIKPAALVTGGAIRMGRELVLSLARAGHDVIVHFNRSCDAALVTAQEARDLGVQTVVMERDLTKLDGLEALIVDAKTALPHLGILVNSASGYSPASLLELTASTYEEQMAVNLRAPIFLTKSFASCVGNGLVVNILDNKVAFNQYVYLAYLLSKKALREFTLMAAIELAPHIRVNAISPGVVLPASSRSSDYVAWRIEGIPMQASGKPQDIARALHYLIESPFVTGQVMTVDGGEGESTLGRNAVEYAKDHDPSGT